ncbi:MAG: twin-arginine translocation signal domain-containing protein [Holophagales bacterium]|nr:twin-arginine translocation signal domain-containing protein [Holophagales bacterium]
MTDRADLSSTVPSPATEDALAKTPSGGLDRRAFIKATSTAAAVALAGTHLAREAQASDAKTGTKSGGRVLAAPRADAARDLKGGWFVV